MSASAALIAPLAKISLIERYVLFYHIIMSCEIASCSPTMVPPLIAETPISSGFLAWLSLERS